MSQHFATLRRRPLNYVLWTLQVLLALLFLWAGGFKLVATLEQMAGPVSLPGPFLRFLGIAEVLGGLGLILPAALRIRPMLTPLAALGLVVIMTGAVVITWPAGGLGMAAIPLVTGLLLVLVGWGRWKLVPVRKRGEQAAAVPEERTGALAGAEE